MNFFKYIYLFEINVVFTEFYDETDVNKQGLECLRLLNEIICDFDKLLLKPKFSAIEKIKTIGKPIEYNYE